MDTRAKVTVISPKAHREIGNPTLCTPKKILHSPSNRKLQVKGQLTAKLKCGSNEVEQGMFVVQNLHSHFFGCPAIETLDFGSRTLVPVSVIIIKNLKKTAQLFALQVFLRAWVNWKEHTLFNSKKGAKPFMMLVPR